MDSTIIKMQVNSKKESMYGDAKATAIELVIPYSSPPTVYYQLSGGTTMTLNTINQEAADIFEIGKFYDVVVSPSKE